MYLKEHLTPKGEKILYMGSPNLSMLDKLALKEGDVWHSSLDQGYKNALPELIYQTVVFFLVHK